MAEREKLREQRREQRNRELDEIHSIDEMRFAKEFDEEHKERREYNAMKKEK